MERTTSSLLRFTIGFICALIGIGILINREFFSLDSVMYGILLNALGLVLIVTSKFHFIRQIKDDE